jgi:homopolymeric O-antigen transport system ATP-binding protein
MSHEHHASGSAPLEWLGHARALAWVGNPLNLALRVEGLGKRYRIGAPGPRARTLGEVLANAAAAPIRNFRRVRGLSSFRRADLDIVWALRDVGFELQESEVLGIIGRNGAGKSTLLKILSRVTDPTTGFAEIRGRIGSLLEVGTGFHPELTGRENVYLNGAILGMDRAYITDKFEEIVEFAGIGAFIDTPVKRYSSGMHLRLAFAVAAHLEPELLIIDEVLAVGDAEFQRKCLGRMDALARGGRTVLFVSHDLGAIQRLCTRAILLARGQVVADGETAEVVARYLASDGSEAPSAQWLDLSSAERAGSGAARFVGVCYSGPDPTVDFRPFPAGSLDVKVRIQATSLIPRATIGFTLRDQYGATLMSGSNTANGSTLPLPAGVSTWVFRVLSLPLRPGVYHLELWLGDPVEILDRLQPALRLEVFDRQRRAAGPRYDPRYDGPVFFEYQVSAAENEDL